MGSECFGQPFIEPALLAALRPHEIEITGEQTFGRGETDEILGRFDVLFEMLVLRFDVFDRFRWGVVGPVAGENGVRVCHVFQQVVDGLVRRLRGRGGTEQAHREWKNDKQTEKFLHADRSKQDPSLLASTRNWLPEFRRCASDWSALSLRT